LEEAFRAFRAKTTARTRKFPEFLKTNAGWLDDYTLFRALMDVHGGSPNWESWPAEHRTPRAAQAWLRALPEERQAEMETRREFFGYVQWIAFDQWTTIKQQGSRQRVALMGDIPFGVSRYSADVWANRELFDLDWSGGAPPEKVFQVDPFTEKWGQNWGIPLYRWDVMRARGFDWWRRRVGIVQRLFHIYRIDHVLGFYRIYAFPWPPQRNGEFEKLTESDAAEKTGGRLPRFFPEPDTTEKQQAINRAQGDELLRMVQAASGDTVVIAEDLGLVPPYVRPHLLELGIPGFKIPHWERTPDYTYVEGAEYPRLSVCTPATHDHEPVAAMWRQMWRAHEEAIAQRHDHQAYVTWLELQRLCWWIGLDGQHIPREFTAKIHACYCRTVLACNAWLALFLITDIFAEKTRFNLPGSVGASNWSARLGTTVAGLDHDPQLRAKTQMFEQLVRSNQRLP
jgi:4-alpha-glucanotransferase